MDGNAILSQRYSCAILDVLHEGRYFCGESLLAPTSILHFPYGPGQWCAEIAAEYREAQVEACDIAPLHEESKQSLSNLTFLVCDVATMIAAVRKHGFMFADNIVCVVQVQGLKVFYEGCFRGLAIHGRLQQYHIDPCIHL
jgi:hypothetical protein